ncbi:MAG: prolyl oligopeptidase family serine peptidase [Verrucomicrobiae bacterium]|nr:prolyl oligopeptidase family serine peptidase [Verrucomicrobiae bacterium]
MKRLLPLLLLWLGLTSCSTSPEHFPAMKPGLTPHQFSVERKQVLAADYLLSLPDGYVADPAKRWPLILFLHGAGERGADVWLVAKHGPFKTEAATNNFIIVSPLCPAGKIWSEDVVLALLDDIEAKYPVDTHRVYLTGLSMGGFGAWNLGLSHPEKFAAMAPICGGGQTIPIILAKVYDAATLANMRSLGIWAFHGGKDTTVPPGESEHMVKALQQAGCTDVKLTIYPEATHDSWTQAYSDPELFAWFLKHSR